MVPVTNALGGPQGANNNVDEQQIKARLKQALEDLKTGAINKNQFFDQVKTECLLQDTKLVEPAELKRMVELTELNPIRALGHANGLYDLMVKQSWTTSEGMYVFPAKHRYVTNFLNYLDRLRKVAALDQRSERQRQKHKNYYFSKFGYHYTH